jgi:spore maturation protein CgeB
MTRVLLVTPAFHGYWQAIADALDRRGHETTVHEYDAHDSWWAKARHQLDTRVPAAAGVDRTPALRARTTTAALAALAEHRPDVVVVVKGDALGPDFWARLDELGVPRVLWLYDELRRTGWETGGLEAVGPIASYSPLDVATLSERGLTASFLPLAYDRDLDHAPGSARRDEVSFVGARYAAREQILVALAAAGIPVRAYGRDWSRHPVDRLRTWDWRRPGVPGERDVDRATAYAVMAASAATLNLHTDQDGFTMRTFEACGVGAVQLIDRADLDGLYDVGTELASWSSVEELVELCRRARVDRAWADGLRVRGRARTLAEHTFDHRVAVLEELWC